jgi:hypothetical protein
MSDVKRKHWQFRTYIYIPTLIKSQ